ncbi:MAG TPA: DUF6675 family protein [Gemmatimonadaceae bacterium]|nr:DUF6675 family protein [Gemmatimonadaceae bacterium]
MLTLRTISIIFAASTALADGQGGPVPPCGGAVVPAYTGVNDEPATKLWRPADVSNGWSLPPCAGWRTSGFASLVAVSGRFHMSGGAAAILGRIAAVSSLKGVRYWSPSHGAWRELILDASALTSASEDARRKDFTAADLRAGDTLFVMQRDNLIGKAVYRLTVRESSPNRIVIGMENATTMKFMLMKIFDPGEMQSVYFFDRESPDVWRYYSLTRMSDRANKMAVGKPASSINRAVAFYRHFAGIQTDKEPPAARMP